MKTMECPTCNETWEAGKDGRCSSCGGSERIAESGADAPACYALRVLKWAHCGKEGWMSEYATMIEIEDEGAGEFLLLTQPYASTKLSNGGIAISPEEWPTLRAAIEAAFADISKHNR